MNTREFKVIVITTYGSDEDDPEYRANNKMHPEIVPYVEDEQDLFVVDTKSNRFWFASKFFAATHVDSFTVER